MEIWNTRHDIEGKWRETNESICCRCCDTNTLSFLPPTSVDKFRGNVSLLEFIFMQHKMFSFTSNESLCSVTKQTVDLIAFRREGSKPLVSYLFSLQIFGSTSRSETLLKSVNVRLEWENLIIRLHVLFVVCSVCDLRARELRAKIIMGCHRRCL